MDRIIWMLWFQGSENAPFLVRRCIESWRKLNPGWRFILLDESNLKKYVDVEDIIGRNADFITKQARANVVRMHLLQKYGGVWVDVSCFCIKPLDSWLPEVMVSGFFAFRDPGPDRIMSNWFLASEQGCYLTEEMTRRVDAYWSQNTFNGINTSVGRRARQWLLRKSKDSLVLSRLWFTYAVKDLLKIYPLYWFHYLFADAVRSDKRFRSVWEFTPYRAAGPIHRIQQFGQSRPADAALMASVRDNAEPFYKLSWKKVPTSGLVPGSALEYLLHDGFPSSKL